MTRDMELIRRILTEVQARSDLDARILRFDDVDDMVLGRHVEMLFHAGYLEGVSQKISSLPYARVGVRDLTWEGHDFVAAMKNEGVWAKVKASLSPSELATLPLSVVKEAGVALLKQYVFEKIGLGGR